VTVPSSPSNAWRSWWNSSRDIDGDDGDVSALVKVIALGSDVEGSDVPIISLMQPSD
jgi:hypothetical protein